MKNLILILLVCFSLFPFIRVIREENDHQVVNDEIAFISQVPGNVSEHFDELNDYFDSKPYRKIFFKTFEKSVRAVYESKTLSREFNLHTRAIVTSVITQLDINTVLVKTTCKQVELYNDRNGTKKNYNPAKTYPAAGLHKRSSPISKEMETRTYDRLINEMRQKHQAVTKIVAMTPKKEHKP